MKIKLSIISLIILINFNFSYSQEMLFDLESNSQIINQKHISRRLIDTQIVSLELPFFDDFSWSNVNTSDSLWSDNYAFINNTYAIQPPSVGVATLDALDEHGKLYNTLASSPKIADSLTSMPINLSNYNASDSIYISFAYQAKGLGNKPEETDSLALEFYSPVDNSWHWQWSIAGGNAETEFTNIILHIPDSLFYFDNFKFRFYNYVSLGNEYEPSWIKNSDMWNLDFIYINKNRTKTEVLINDFAFISNPTSLIPEFQSVPWLHYKADTTAFKLENILCSYKNSTIISSRSINRAHKIINNENNSLISHTPSQDWVNSNSNSIDTIDVPALFSVFPVNDNNEASFDIFCYFDSIVLQTPKHRLMFNDTAKYTQVFQNFYSYDDGTAEQGYGVSGEGTQHSMVACKYHTYKADVLSAIQIFFNSTTNSPIPYFYLCVWANNNGVPGDTLYSQIGVRPEYENDINKFHTYILEETLNLPVGDFFIGWTKTTNDMLNAGFDANTESTGKLFYNTTGTWTQSSYSGSLMIRPIFGDLRPEQSSVDAIKKNTNTISIYPNPAKDYLYINSNIDLKFKNLQYNIYDISGKLVLSKTTAELKINIQSLKSGFYIIQILENNRILLNNKLLIE